MNEQDKEAFEKWWMDGFKGMSDKDIVKYKNVGKQSAMNGWQAALEHERARSKKLVEGLERLSKITVLAESAKYIINDALTEYRGEKEGGE